MSEQQDNAEPSGASAGSHGNQLSVLRDLIEGVRGMGLGDPDCGDRIEASDVVRWAVEEIERLRLTDEEQLAIAWAAREADEWDEDDVFATPEVAAHAEVLRGLARRLF